MNQVILCHILGMPLANLCLLRQDYGCMNIIECCKSGMRLRRMNIMELHV
jgi:probable phosphoglycerate mutase